MLCHITDHFVLPVRFLIAKKVLKVEKEKREEAAAAAAESNHKKHSKSGEGHRTGQTHLTRK